MAASPEEETIGFESTIKHLFREHDRESMLKAFDLWSFDDVSANANAILARLRDGSMPCDGAWPGDRIERFQQWIDAGQPR